MNLAPTFEVETRICFSSSNEAFALIPFLKNALTKQNRWSTTHYGFHLFKGDQILRISETIDGELHSRFYLGWKGNDLGRFVNIREEIDEEITKGIKDSRILTRLGGQTGHASPKSVLTELTRLGFDPFMSFHGCNQTGFYQPLGIHLKLMDCASLKTPFLVEIEKAASNFEDALHQEKELQQIVAELELTDRMIREEPPALLFATLSK